MKLFKKETDTVAHTWPTGATDNGGWTLRRLGRVSLLVLAAGVAAFALYYVFKTKKEVEKGYHLTAKENGVLIEKTGPAPLPDTIGFAAVDLSPVGEGIVVPMRVACAYLPGTGRIFDNPQANQAFADYLTTQAGLAVAQVTFAKQRDLYEAKIISERDLLETRLKYEQAAVALAKSAEDVRVNAGIPVETVLNLAPGTLIVAVDFPETERERLRAGVPIDLQFNAYPGRHWLAHIQGVGNQVNPLTRTVKAYVHFPNPNNELSAGMFGTAEIKTQVTAVLAVPAESVIQIGAEAYVFRVESDTLFRRVAVVTGAEDDHRIEIKKGLKKGDRIVSRGSSFMKGISFGY